MPQLTEEMIDRMTPLEKLQACYADAPKTIARYLDCAIVSMLRQTLGRAKILMHSTYCMKRAELRPVADPFNMSMAYMDSHDPKTGRTYDATVRSAVNDIGEAVDSAIRRVLLENTELNRDAFLDISGGHAMIARGLSDLAEIPTPTAEALAEAQAEKAVKH